MDRYQIEPEGLGEINIEDCNNGEWVRYDDVINILQRLSNDGGLDKDCMKIMIDAIAG